MLYIRLLIQGENPRQVLLVLPGLTSVRLDYAIPCAKAALVSTKESLIHTRETRNAVALWALTTRNSVLSLADNKQSPTANSCMMSFDHCLRYSSVVIISVVQ